MLKLIGGIWGFFGSIIGMISNVFGFLKQRDSEENSPVMVENKENIQLQQEKDQINKDLQNNNISNLEKDIAE